MQMQMLKLGSRGTDVMRYQKELNSRMLRPNNQLTRPPLNKLDTDGSFGPKTQAMVKEFQRLNQIKPDGIIGPDTSYLLLPYIAFTALFFGRGRIRGRKVIPGLEIPVGSSPATRLSFGKSLQSGTANSKGELTLGDNEEKEGLNFELSVGQGLKHSFQPWYVLIPNEDPEGAKSEASLAVEATILRKKGFEFGLGLEFDRQLRTSGRATWQWEGGIKGTYTNATKKIGDIFTPFSPVADLSVKQGLNLGVGIGAEATLQLSEDLLELSVGGNFAGEWDPHEGSIKVGLEVSGALKLKLDVVRLIRK